MTRTIGPNHGHSPCLLCNCVVLVSYTARVPAEPNCVRQPGNPSIYVGMRAVYNLQAGRAARGLRPEVLRAKAVSQAQGLQQPAGVGTATVHPSPPVPRTHSGLVGHPLVGQPHHPLVLQEKWALSPKDIDWPVAWEGDYHSKPLPSEKRKPLPSSFPGNLLQNQAPIPTQLGKNALEKIIEDVEKRWGDTPLPHRLQHSLPWWEKWATPQIVSLIREGITPQWENPPHLSVQGRQGENLEQAQKILEDYEKCGAVKRVNHREPSTFSHGF